MLAWDHYLTYIHCGSHTLKDKVIRYNRVTGVKRIKVPNEFKMNTWFMCQMDYKTVFQVQDGDVKCRTLIMDSDKFKEVRPMPDYPGKKREWPSLCRVSSTHAFLIGGNVYGDTLKSCLRFDMATKEWEEMPSMIEEREKCSSCRLGKNLFVFCGYSAKKSYVGSIERLQIVESASN